MSSKRFKRSFTILVSVLWAFGIAAVPVLAGTTEAPAAPGGGANGTADLHSPVQSTESSSQCRATGTVKAAYPYVSQKRSKSPLDAEVQLGDVLAVEVSDLNKLNTDLQSPACKGKQLILYLDGLPIPELVAFPPSNPQEGRLLFTLTPTDKSRAEWAHILGSPGWHTRDTAVSVGLADGFAFSSEDPKASTIHLAVIPQLRFMLWALLFGAILIGFFVLAAKSDVLRDTGPSPGGGARRPFSLARTQAAWWFFIVLGSYLLIGMVTTNVLSSITGSVLVLLGISAGTVVGASAVDASQQTSDNKARQVAAQAQLTVQELEAKTGVRNAEAAERDQVTRVTQAAQVVTNAQEALNNKPADPKAVQTAVDAAQAAHAAQVAESAQTAAAVAAAKAALAEKQSQLKAARNETENFLIDILSDADGVDFHRFQNAAWTLVLGIIFACQVYRELAMPQFDGTLLALMGISAGTYVAMKVNEAKVPTM